MLNDVHAVAGGLCVSLIIIRLSLLTSVRGATDVCNGDRFNASCADDEVFVADSALYGRMEAGRCGVTSDGGQIGCSNDVTFLMDRMCSGRRRCHFIVGNNDFFEANTDCNREHRAYMTISYSCIKVAYQTFDRCLTESRVQLDANEGFISSHVTDEVACGSSRTPWWIKAKPGQTIDLWMMDFGALSRRGSHRECPDVYGYVQERSLRVNRTICAGTERQRELYSSKSNEVQIVVLTPRQDAGSFMIHYKVSGCSDLTPPAHAWYKREGDTATIGCDGSENRWQLTCRGNSWHGVVGNCSAKPFASADTDKESIIDLPLKTLLIVAAIAGATIVLAVLIIVAGVVCVKKYRHQAESRAGSVSGTLVYKPKLTGETLPRGQYHPMMMVPAQPGSSTMGSIQRACTMVHCGRPGTTQQAYRAVGTMLPPNGRWTAKKGAPPPPTRPPAPLPPGEPQPEPSTSSGITRTSNARHPLWSQPLPEDQLSPEGVYQNPDEVVPSAFRPHQPPGGASGDPDDICSYYAPTTGHKYFVLERQPEQTPAQPQS